MYMSVERSRLKQCRDQWQVGTAVLMNIQIFWNTAPGRLVNSLEELADAIVRIRIVPSRALKSWRWRQQTLQKRQQLYTNRRCFISQITVIFSDGMLWTPTVVQNAGNFIAWRETKFSFSRWSVLNRAGWYSNYCYVTFNSGTEVVMWSFVDRLVMSCF